MGGKETWRHGNKACRASSILKKFFWGADRTCERTHTHTQTRMNRQALPSELDRSKGEKGKERNKETKASVNEWTATQQQASLEGEKNSFMQNIQQNMNTKKHTQILLSRVRWKQRLHSRLPSTQLAKIQHSHAPTCWLLGRAWTSAPQTAGQESNPAGGQGLLLSYHSYFHCPKTHLGWQRCIYHYSGEKKKALTTDNACFC